MLNRKTKAELIEIVKDQRNKMAKDCRFYAKKREKDENKFHEINEIIKKMCNTCKSAHCEECEINKMKKVISEEE